MTEKEIKLVEENIPRALHVAKRWIEVTGMDRDDVISAAEYGLVKAAMGFDYDRGFRFSTYATRIMENEIRMELRKHSRRSGEMHLEDPIEGTEGLKLKDMLADPRDCFELSEAVCELAERSGTLTERERTAVMIRIEYPEKSQAECGRMMGISQSLFSRRLIDARRKMAGA